MSRPDLPSRTRRPRRPVLAAALLLLAMWPLWAAGSVSAAFTAQTIPPGSSLVSDTLDGVSGLTATRQCVPPAPVLRSSASATGLVNTLAVPRPAGVVAGDVLVALVIHHDATNPPQPPAGWSVLHRGSAGEELLAVRVATASEPASYAFSGLDNSDATAASILAYSGADPVAPVMASAATTSGSSTTVIAPSVTASGVRARLVTGLMVDDYLGTITTPAGTTSRTFVQAPGPQEVTMRAVDREVTVTGATGSVLAAITASKQSTGFSLLLRSGTTAGQVDLSWAPTPDAYASGYEVRRNGVLLATLSGIGSTGYRDSALAAGSSATYAVVSAAGTWRSASASAAVAAC